MKCLNCGTYFDSNNCPQCGSSREDMANQNKNYTNQWIENYTANFVRRPNSNIIPPGRYVFGIDLPLGAYLLRVIKGTGMIEFHRKREKGEDPDDYACITKAWIGLITNYDGTLDNRPLEYQLHGARQGEWVTIDDGLSCEISKQEMMKFE